MLSRERDESIVIDGGRIIVTVVRCTPRKVKLAVVAPPEVTVDREEIHIRKLADGARGGRS